jgi:hypothetical protein
MCPMNGMAGRVLCDDREDVRKYFRNDFPDLETRF